MLRRAFLVLAVCAGLAWLGGSTPGNAALEVVVTSAGDSVAAGESECPSATRCTLRRAIELVNADTSAGVYTIRFDQAVFDPDEPIEILVLDTPLPAITRADGTVDASDAGVRVRSGAVMGSKSLVGSEWLMKCVHP